MPTFRPFRDKRRIGPVSIATYQDGRGRTRHVAACSAPGCGFSADYDDRSAAELAANTHRCA
ncbi:mobile element transfer protein [Streptomyces sp. NPDC090306]|uniref:mobile element transfer protein n=1 Tax=Streptomyces sp. NPDC090306 TaxID=3365961 RepID=UPI00382B07A8